MENQAKVGDMRINPDLLDWVEGGGGVGGLPNSALLRPRVE